MEKLLLETPEINPSLINFVLERGYLPKKEIFIARRELIKYPRLLKAALKQDPTIIIFFEYIDDETREILAQQRYVLTREDLNQNENLGKDSKLMKEAIEKDPSLIVFVKGEEVLEHSDVCAALAKYTVTKKDLEEHPALCSNYKIMHLNPHLRSYNKYLSTSDKKAIIAECLQSGNFDDLSELPFLRKKFGGNYENDQATRIARLFYLDIDEENIEQQKGFYQDLDHIINAILSLRYENNRNNFLFSDIVSLHEEILNVIKKDANSTEPILKKFIDEIIEFTGEGIDVEYLNVSIYQLYEMYKKGINITLDDSGELCNYILNQHRNNYMSLEKRNIIESLKITFNVTSKKKELIYIGRKLDKISGLIAKKEYSILGISESDLNQIFDEIRTTLKNNKDLRKKGIDISDEDFLKLKNVFLQAGIMAPKAIEIILGEDLDNESTNYILKKFNNILYRLSSNVGLNSNGLFISKYEKKKLGFNYNNFVIGERDKCLNHIAELILSLDEKQIQSILIYTNGLSTLVPRNEIKRLIPFVQMFPEFDIKSLKSMIIFYSKIKEKIESTYGAGIDIVSKFEDVYRLAEGYSGITNISLAILGKDIIKKVGEQDIGKYLTYYLFRILPRKEGTIPAITFEKEDYIFESGRFDDTDRLIIGRTFGSCIDLTNSAGKATYDECLASSNGDVITIKNKSTSEFVDRILAVRRGNVVQLFARAYSGYSVQCYEEIAKQIISKSEIVGDNIDYVFVNDFSIPIPFRNCENIKYSDSRLVKSFPHADLIDSAILVGRSKNSYFYDIENRIDFDISPNCKYLKVRKKISLDPSDEEIIRIKALDIYMNGKIQNLEPFYREEYTKVICGEDWYIAVKNNGEVEEVILPSSDERTLQEFNITKASLKILLGPKKA